MARKDKKEKKYIDKCKAVLLSWNLFYPDKDCI